MKQKVVGIVPYAPDFGKNESRYEDKYHFTDTYEVRAYEAGLLPIGVLPVEGRIRYFTIWKVKSAAKIIIFCQINKFFVK